MSDTKTQSKMVAVQFDIKDLNLTEGTTSVFGVPVELNKDETKFVGKCSAEELAAFEEAGKAEAGKEDTSDSGDDMTKAELKDELTKLEVEFPSSANKAELQKLLDDKLAE